MFVGPLLKGHGLTYDDFSPLNNTQSGAVDLLADGNADAAFLGGAVPTGSITQACSSHNIVFIPFDAASKAKLVADFEFFQPFTVSKDKYSDLDKDFEGLNVGSMHLIASAGMDDEMAYQLAKTIWEHRADIAGKHPAGRAINEKNAARYTGTEFHPGAVRFYKEVGIWPEADGEAGSDAATPADSKDAEAK
jgi:TRAP transporter TAXI family solute receptor